MSDEKREQEAETPMDSDVFPVVGIGASAGGLEAFERFFVNLPANTGMAFVLVQHLAPDHDSMLADLIERYTDMPVYQVTNEMLVEPNTVYIIPPNRNMALQDGRLILTEPAKPHGYQLPVDYLFRSLAKDQRERAVCIVLSGTASDGTLGVKAVKGEGGMAMAQEPETARYAGMPQSAISTGMIDFILSPEDMPAQLQKYVNQAVISPANGEHVIPESEADMLDEVFAVLRRQTGHDFSQYKRKTLTRRIERRMIVSQRDNLGRYLQFLRKNPIEVESLFKDLLIGVTRFFRDDDAFEVLSEKVIPTIIKDKEPGETIRVWIVACSTGEEAYSIAMLFYDKLKMVDKHIDLQIFATDIDSEAVDRARTGYYPDNIAADVPPDLLKRHFIEEKNGYRVKKHLRNIVIFAEQSVIKDPPFSRLDLISCRNLMIYLSLRIQKRVIQLFHYGLKTGGYLFLGTSETLSGFTNLFETVDKKWKTYRRLEGASPRQSMYFGGELEGILEGNMRLPKSDTDSLESMVQGALLARYNHPAVIINKQGEVLYFHGETSPFLRPASGAASLNVLKLIIPELRISLSTGVQQIMRHNREVVQDIVHVQTGEQSQAVRLVLQPLQQTADAESLTFIIFEEVSTQKIPSSEAAGQELTLDDKDRRILALDQELRSTREYLQTTIEELETSNEELKSANEELQSSNEEFQSTNEELETTKEELQSVNEDLMNVNNELNNKVEQITDVSNHQKNLLDNMDVGLVFMHKDLTIRLFNPIASELLNLIPEDVGRTIRHFASNFDYHDFAQDCEHVLDTLESVAREVRSDDGRWFITRIRPYRMLNGYPDGLVVTFTNITEQKKMQRYLESQEEIYRTLLEYLPNSAVLAFDADMRYIMVGGEALEEAGFDADYLLGNTLYDALPAERVQRIEGYYESALRGERVEFWSEFDGRHYRNIAIPVVSKEGQIIVGMVMTTERRDIEPPSASDGSLSGEG